MALYQHIPAASVPAEFKELAKDWPVWDSKEADPPLVDGKVHFTYDGDYGSERVLIVSGKATITPDDGTDPVEVGEGDAVYLHKGFECFRLGATRRPRGTGQWLLPLPGCQSRRDRLHRHNRPG